MAELVAHEQLRSIVERLDRLDEEIGALNGDKREVYAEAKANGFDVKILKRVIRDRRIDLAARQEAEAIYDLYAQALGMLPGDDL